MNVIQFKGGSVTVDPSWALLLGGSCPASPRSLRLMRNTEGIKNFFEIAHILKPLTIDFVQVLYENPELAELVRPCLHSVLEDEGVDIPKVVGSIKYLAAVLDSCNQDYMVHRILQIDGNWDLRLLMEALKSRCVYAAEANDLQSEAWRRISQQILVLSYAIENFYNNPQSKLANDLSDINKYLTHELFEAICRVPRSYYGFQTEDLANLLGRLIGFHTEIIQYDLGTLW